ncbi:heterokaryon incompatibility protein-domain-containing protein [Triangularia setosa]|uniref:Heterokaryon incompatibility protein-domain-containing protein n=1 Tax=Triangularia setosa TaxID=2587417 RepID=A0AAN6WCI8_9PEZI|nr:heterokaryon incompatibility protein-domain-containing protein [Podospora setosa]
MADSLCQQCQKLNFSQLWSTKPEDLPDEDGRLIKRTLSEDAIDNCRLCNFFAQAARYYNGDYKEYRTSEGLPEISLRLGAWGWRNTPCLRDNQDLMILIEKQNVEQEKKSSRLIAPDQIDYSLLRGWFSECEEDGMRTYDKYEVDNLRVIDCGHGRGEEQEPRLIAWASVGDELGKEYVALSYVWGTGPGRLPTLQINSTLPGPFPKVISDAIVVVKNMGYRYLWVDRYCIPQGDNDERERQIHAMGRIYESARFTIIAAAGDGPDHGLPGVTATRRLPHPFMKIQGFTLTLIPQPDGYIHHTKWATRGWTLQEGFLSSRHLVFTEHQVFYECQCIQAVEALVGTYQHPYSYSSRELWFHVFASGTSKRRGRGRPGFHYVEQLHGFIENYITRDLTDPNDGLNAFRGILQHAQQAITPIYELCGLPIYDDPKYMGTEDNNSAMAVSLSWKMNNLRRQPEFPSWTWVGWRSVKRTGASSFYLGTDERWYSSSDSKHYITSVDVIFGDDQIIQWSDHDGKGYKKTILEKSSMPGMSELPRSLLITGWLFDLTVVAVDDPSGGTATTAFHTVEIREQYQRPLSFGIELEQLMLFFPVNSDGDRKHTFTCLLLAELDRSNSRSTLVFLALNPVLQTEALLQTYERLDCWTLTSSTPIVRLDDTTMKAGGCLFREDAVVLQ